MFAASTYYQHKYNSLLFLNCSPSPKRLCLCCSLVELIPNNKRGDLPDTFKQGLKTCSWINRPINHLCKTKLCNSLVTTWYRTINSPLNAFWNNSILKPVVKDEHQVTYLYRLTLTLHFLKLVLSGNAWLHRSTNKAFTVTEKSLSFIYLSHHFKVSKLSKQCVELSK